MSSCPGDRQLYSHFPIEILPYNQYCLDVWLPYSQFKGGILLLYSQFSVIGVYVCIGCFTSQETVFQLYTVQMYRRTEEEV